MGVVVVTASPSGKDLVVWLDGPRRHVRTATSRRRMRVVTT